MIETTDRFFLHPRQVLTARKVGIYDAINLVIYAKLPLISARRGKDLVAGLIQRNELSPQQILTRNLTDRIIDKFGTEAASLRYPIGPSQYEPILEQLVEAGEDVLPYFFHEHHLLVDRRRRIAAFTKVNDGLLEEVRKGDVILQLSESERIHYMASGAWMTNKTLIAYLDRQGVTPWWEDELNLASHARVERVMLSDTPTLLSPEVLASYAHLERDITSDTPTLLSLGTLERYDTQQLPSFVFAEMLLRRTRRPRGYAKPVLQASDTIRVEPVIEQRKDARSQNDSNNLNAVNRNAVPCTDGLDDNSDSDSSSSFKNTKHPRPPIRRAESSPAEKESRAGSSNNDEPSQVSSTPLNELATTADQAMLSKNEVALLLGVHANTIDNYRRDQPDFPKPAKLGGKTLRWEQSDILQYKNARKTPAP